MILNSVRLFAALRDDRPRTLGVGTEEWIA
jgi:hypothetical protein